MRIVILQPGYLPWIGFFDQLQRADLFVYYDDVQYDKGGWRNRNRIKTPQGPAWLTVPVESKGHLGQPILEVTIDNRSPWWKKHLGTLRQNYQGAPHFQEIFPGLEEILSTRHDLLVDLDLESTALLAAQLGIDTPTRRSSELDIQNPDPTGRLVDICQHFGADCYLTGDSAENYLDEEKFAEQGISVEYQRYAHPEYSQLHGAFIPFLSAVDLLCNHGPESLNILMGKSK